MRRHDAPAAPGTAGAKIAYQASYDNFIGGSWLAPVKGQYFDVITPISGRCYTQVARSTAEDIDLALDAAHAAADKWGRTAPADRANVPLRIADRLEARPGHRRRQLRGAQAGRIDADQYPESVA